jgi:hypothetical protein
MPTLADLRNAIEKVLKLPIAGQVLQLNSNTRERAFECYVFALLVQAVRQAGGTAILVGIHSGINPVNAVFRGGPGRLGSTADDYAYASCRLGQNEFEIHLDVQYVGGSGAIHEVDVSIYDHTAAERVRQNPNEFARVRYLNAAFECKCYDSRLGTVLGRTFVGLIADCGTVRLKAFASNGSSPGLAKYFQPTNRPDLFLELSPLRTAVESRFVDFFEQEFRRWSGVG